MGRREGYAKPVAIASFSMDPVLINWLNGYALEHKTTKSKIVRMALTDFKEKTVLNEKLDCKKCGARNDREFAYMGCWKCKESLDV